MPGREIKISKGLLRLLNYKNKDDNWSKPNIFIDNPSNRSDYFEMFRKAQIVEIANSKVL